MLGLSPSNRSAFFLHADLLGLMDVDDLPQQQQLESTIDKQSTRSDENIKEVRAPASEPPPHVRQRKRKHEESSRDPDDELTPAAGAAQACHPAPRLPYSAQPATTIPTLGIDGPPTREGSIRRLRSRLDFSEEHLEIASKEFTVSLNASLSLAHSFEMDHGEMKEDPVEIVPSSIPSDTATHDKDNLNTSREDPPEATRNSAADADHVKSPALPAAAFPFTQPLESLMVVAPEMSLSARLSQSPPSPFERPPLRESERDDEDILPSSVPSSQAPREGGDESASADDGWCFPSASAEIVDASMPSRSQSRYILSRRSSSRAPPLPLPLPSSATNSPSFIPTSPSAASSVAPPSTAASMLSSHVADLELPSQLLGGGIPFSSRSRHGLSQTSRASFKGSGNASNAASSVLAGASLPFCTPPAVVPPVASSKALTSIAQTHESPASSPSAFQYDPFQLTQSLLYPENSSASISAASSHLLSKLSNLHASYPDWIARIESLIRVMQELRYDEFKFANLTFLHSLLINGEISGKQLPPFHAETSLPSFPSPSQQPHDVTFAPPAPRVESIPGVNPQCWEWIRKTTAEQLQEQHIRRQKQAKEDTADTSVMRVKSQLPPIGPLVPTSAPSKPVVSSLSRRNGNRAVLPLPLPTTSSQDSAPAHISDLLSELD